MRQDRFSVVGKYVILTGAAGGIGLALTRAFLEAKAHVIAINRRDGIDWQGLDEAYSETFDCFLCDLSDTNAVQSLAMELIERYPTIDVLINNACLNNLPSGNAYDISVYEEIRKVGLDAPYVLC